MYIRILVPALCYVLRVRRLLIFAVSTVALPVLEDIDPAADLLSLGSGVCIQRLGLLDRLRLFGFA